MSVWNPLSLLALASPSRHEAAQMARRWSLAIAADPRLAADLVRMGGLLDGEMREPVLDADGTPTGLYEIVKPDPTVLAMRSGRRELAQQLLALAKTDPTQLLTMMEPTHEPD